MDIQLDPEVLEYIQSLPPELRKIMLLKFLSGKSQLVNQDGKKGVFTPGKGGSTVYPNPDGAQGPTLMDAFDNQRYKRAKSVPRN